MIFRTQIPIFKQTNNQIDYYSKIVSFGSCFSENIAQKLGYYKFQYYQNPFGILFHPKAIENLISNAIHEKKYTENDLIFKNERWHCFDAHSSLSTTDKNDLLLSLNSALIETKKQIQEASHIIITLGTSWVYRFIERNNIVANCHKIPQKKFTKELLSIDEISKILENIVTLIKAEKTTTQVLFTVSPVRHLKDGFVANSQSKSHLISAIHAVVNRTNQTHYFPSYEIMMDELRDYRFFTEDMLHPNTTAINYIWKKFVATWFSDATLSTLQEVATIQKGISHKPFNEKSKEHQLFLKKLSVKKETIKKQYPFIRF